MSRKDSNLVYPDSWVPPAEQAKIVRDLIAAGDCTTCSAPRASRPGECPECRDEARQDL
jgi:hypothetical protein